jgi:hypothetical protein
VVLFAAPCVDQSSRKADSRVGARTQFTGSQQKETFMAKRRRRAAAATTNPSPSRAVDASRGTTLWTFNYYRSTMLTRLLDDLVTLEQTGLDDALCAKIHQSLSYFSNAATDVPSGGFLTEPIYKDIDRFVELYDEWNRIQGQERFHINERRWVHKQLRQQRQKITDKARKLQYELDNNLDRLVMESTYRALADLITMGPNLFQNLGKALAEFTKRGGTL